MNSNNHLIYLFFIVVLYIPGLVNAQPINIEKPGSWVKPVDFNEKSKVDIYNVKGGVHFKLIDYQTNFTSGSSYYHFVQNIVSSAGISEASKIELAFDSSYQVLKLHKIIVWRNGKPIDHTKKVTFEYIKNEQQLQSNIYHGLVTALAIVEDIRKNDHLEIAYTLVGVNPIFDGEQYQFIPLGDINRVDKLTVRSLYPSNENYTYQCSGCKSNEVSEKEEGLLTILEIERKDIKAVKLENTMPPWAIPYDYMEVSSTNDWGEVVLWANEIFATTETNLVEPLFEELFQPDESLSKKIDKVIDFVQDDIRYMGIESGMGSIKPFSPNRTIEQRFGDCKDKSLLMVSMLRKLGIEKSYPALVNTMMQHDIDKYAPSGHVFDHCIVYFEFEGKPVWIDPTASYQGGSFRDIKTYNYGKALIIEKGRTDLVKMNIHDTLSSTEVSEVFDFSSFDKPGKLTIESNLTGTQADMIRQIVEFYSKEELAEGFKYPYSLLYPSLIEKKKLALKDNVNDNVINTIESYEVSNAWIEDMEGYNGYRVLRFEPVNLYNYIASISCEKKQYPVHFNYPAQYSQKTIVKLPDNFTISLENKTYDNPAFTFQKEAKMLDSKTAELNYRYQGKSKQVLPEDFEQVCQDLNEIMHATVITFSFPKNKNQLVTNFLNYQFKAPTLSGTDTDTENLQNYIAWKTNVVQTSDSTGLSNDEPEYLGGKKAFRAYVKEKMSYPEDAKANGISGRVYVSFVVSKSGEIQSTKVVQGIGYGCDEEAIRLVKESKDWVPAKDVTGSFIDAPKIEPITFKL